MQLHYSTVSYQSELLVSVYGQKALARDKSYLHSEPYQRRFLFGLQNVNVAGFVKLLHVIMSDLSNFIDFFLILFQYQFNQEDRKATTLHSISSSSSEDFRLMKPINLIASTQTNPKLIGAEIAHLELSRKSQTFSNFSAFARFKFNLILRDFLFLNFHFLFLRLHSSEVEHRLKKLKEK